MLSVFLCGLYNKCLWSTSFIYYIAYTLHSRKPVEPQAEKQKKAESSSQSALIILVYRVDLIFLRVWNYKKGCKKAGSKKHSAKHRVILTYSKREEKRLPLLFLNNNDPVFPPCFLHSIFWTVFSGSQNNPCFQNKNS